MLKQITMDVADFDTETGETIADIRKARDEQVWLKSSIHQCQTVIPDD